MVETTQLQAINTMLSCIGESPVSSLSSTHSADVTVAMNILDEVCRDLMTREWYWNTKKNVTLIPNASGKIIVPTNWVRIDHETLDLIKRGAYLWDRENETDVFTTQVTELTVVMFLDWNDMPEAARRYCMIRGGRTLAARMVSSEKAVGFTERDEQQAFMVLREFEVEQADYNMFNNPDIAYRNRRWA